MKRLLLLLFALILSIALVACNESSSTTDSKKEDKPETEEKEDKKEEKKEEKKLGLGDTAEVDGVKMTIKSVSTTDERNEFAETDPATVIKIEYEVENTTDDEIPIGMDLSVYDGTGNKMESYPLDNTMGSLAPGKKIQGTEHFGIEEGPIEVHFLPAVSFSDAAIFELEIE
ncbi:hypothetical protein HNQ35_000017 [Cerasibacillus quisquiliarum]|uniref:DUF4352 domain-containing protein n=1 Tax=Cerasibacillus quisquiliarum TaxID=227865 RepID=A0A511UUJ8_9BACI|nr:DUF4352 domain-containing protein [Cerasibacillus quisquiliarum]MBB5144828.1 hypothetical protein [Cerasibacillus quisquiliarum]GEN30279.1 hypothetical protein CQU01_05170 [Cerasibacillus quisquiliarum]